MATSARHLAVMERYLNEKPWLSGTTFGIGDIPMGVYAYTWFSLPFDKPEFPAIADWYMRLRLRPGYAAQVMIPLT
jgi:glutathione S-transferase